MNYVELHARTAYSFLRGASLPEHLAERALQIGLQSVAVCDRNGFYGIPRFSSAAREKGVRAITGCELTMEDGTILPVLVENERGYRNLCTLLSLAHLRAPKGGCAIAWEELPGFCEGLIALTGDEEGPLRRAFQIGPSEADAVLQKLSRLFGPGNVFLELQRHLIRGENRVLHQLAALGRRRGLPLLATNGVLYATAQGRQVLDVFACLRAHTHLDEAGLLLSPNSERRLKSGIEMGTLFPDYPEAISNTVSLAERLTFSLENLGYQFPHYDTPDDSSQADFLRYATLEGAHRRYGKRIPRNVLRQLRHELELINRLNFAGYFLIVWDLVNFCRSQNILVQGRGSAANSAVCYCLGITAVDAVECKLLFERFLSEGRTSWPDIDLDLPSGHRRESVIQEVYRRYGRHGAAMTANVITYRGRSAAREIGKALNFPESLIERFSALFSSGDYPHTLPLEAQLIEAGIPPEHPRTPAFLSLYQSIYGLPRHLGQHSGGMIICKEKLSSIVPLENASMPDRSVAQWDKEDCDSLGIIKVDLLGLGMMSVLQDTVELCSQRGCPVDLATIPKDDSAVFDLMCAADTIGVFQIESRAQMATLPRMQPRCFYDVCIEVAIIRPGPIQGDLVHPYLARRTGKEPAQYDDERLIPVLERTLGVPLFQEQLLKIAMVMGDFTGSEAEELRRALSFHRSPERMARVTLKLCERMAQKGIAQHVIERIAKSVGSFALYGFPESHAISFAILAYGSAWLKVHRGAEFFASLLNNQPMGFYSAATLIEDARRHKIRVRPVCIVQSEWRCFLEADSALRLGLCLVRGLSQIRGEELLARRSERPFKSITDLKARVPLHKDELRLLAEIGALNPLAGHRRDALWQIEQTQLPEDDLFAGLSENSASPLDAMNAGERLQADYRGTGLTTGPHPMA
ncbi:MAG: polymerase alpha subunit, partial [Chthoniobacteraceae bacterium]|nr:polymerase alpha subunit [Chthoniobacteraceae bacterium]